MWISNAGMERDRISALKRSFEVENVDSSSNSSSPHMRRSPSIQRSSISPSISRRHELGANGAIKPKPQTPEAASRRAELSIGINPKPVDSSPSAGISRFNLRKPDILGHNKMLESQKHSVTFSKTLETTNPIVRTPSNVSARQLPETTFRRNEPLEINVSKPPEVKGPENHQHSSAITMGCPSFSHAGRKSPNNDGHSSEISTGFHGNMADKGAEKGADKGVELGYVGIDAILEQMRRKAMKQGFEFNIMVVGQSGLGKSTLINTLFKSKVSRRSVMPSSEERIPQTIEIKSISHDIEEKGVRMKLTVIDTPGFGDQINNENCWMPIMKFINEQYEAFLQEEVNISRKKKIPDTRVHCCIYFIPPTGHCLRPIDIEFMRHLSKVVNIVPVIAKADTLTLEERDFFKKKIREDLRANEIEVYPQTEFDEDAEDRIINQKIRDMIPFAVVGSDQEYQVNGKRLLGRKTRWGTVEVENVAHCEFAYLRDLLIRTHMQNLKDITSSIHYEVYRVRRLNESNTLATHSGGEANGLLSHEM
ncbi:septin 9b isoform X1 [Neoarius graeffei]|uniref:septin 9b isoform X1 n=2 Tax=Neoarius graeffei TaxID=443677 RepID=UPI00298BF8D2|nr:septin 9b isoform X1 [Neoarius graeffei]